MRITAYVHFSICPITDKNIIVSSTSTLLYIFDDYHQSAQNVYFPHAVQECLENAPFQAGHAPEHRGSPSPDVLEVQVVYGLVQLPCLDW